MTCVTFNQGILCYTEADFKCPHCGKEYNDEKYVDRACNNKSGITRIKCECGLPFYMTVDYMSRAYSFTKYDLNKSKNILK